MKKVGNYGVRSSVSRDDLIEKLNNTDNFSGFLDEDGKALESRIPNIEEFCASYNSVANIHTGTTFSTLPRIQTLSFEYSEQYSGYYVSGNPSSVQGNAICSMPYNELNSLWVMSQSNNAPYSNFEGYWIASSYAYDRGPYCILLVSNRMGAIFYCHYQDGFYSYSMRN